MKDLKVKYMDPIKLYCDNKTAIQIAYNLVQHNRTKHVEVDRHFIKEKLDQRIICFPFVRSTNQLVDVLTKAVLNKDFDSIIDKLGIIDIYTPTWGEVLVGKLFIDFRVIENLLVSLYIVLSYVE